MRVVAALGGNALLRRGEPLDVQTQRFNVRRAVQALAPIAREHELIITHGNGPQVGLLALEAIGSDLPAYPLDVLDAETEGMIGYLLEQELANILGHSSIATLLTRTAVRCDDPAFVTPTKFIGPIYPREKAEELAALHGWTIAADGQSWRRVVPSPEPEDIVELAAIAHLVSGKFVVICAGGGGIPVHRNARGEFEGVEAVVDKDLVSALLARRLGADCLLLLTDVPGVFEGWGSESARLIRSAHVDSLDQSVFPAGSMGPKILAARRFASSSGAPAFIGALADAERLLAGRAGTRIATDCGGITYA